MRARNIVAGSLAAIALCAHAGETSRARPVPPERAARPIASVALADAGFESAAANSSGAADGWLTGQHAGPVSYVFARDGAVSRSGAYSFRIDNVGPEPYGTIDQGVDAVRLRGKTVRFSAWLRTRNVTGNAFGGGAGLRLQTMRGGYVLDQVQMRHDAVSGTTDWARYEVHLRVDEAAEQVDVGVTLFGPGTAWIDDAALDVVLPPAAAAAKPDDARPPAPSPRS